MTTTAAEQYLLELINRARLNPGAEAARLGIDLNASLPEGTLANTARQVLAGNEILDLTASLHSTWMLDTDIFSHTGEKGSQPWDRASAQGYNWWTMGENISVRSLGGDLASAIDSHHSGLFLSSGHRKNILNDSYREIGLGQEEGQFAFSSGAYRSSMLTELFGSSGSNFYLTGVAYTDTDSNSFYTMGEGRAGVVFTAGGASDTSAAAGGYSIGLAASAALRVTGTVGALAFGATVDMAGGNVKLDVVNGSWFYTSATIKLADGILNARLLGLDALGAWGTTAANSLIGNDGANVMSGGAGDDRLLGMGGNDRLRGGGNNDVVKGDAGNDVIHGDSGNDTLSGGAGADRFVFLAGSGVDQITDFSIADGDRLRIDDAVWGGGAMTQASLVAAYARDVGADVLVDFGNGNAIRLVGLQNLTGLAAAIDLI